MANAYTDTTAMSNLIQTAWDRLVEFSLRSQPTFRQMATKRPAALSQPGDTVMFSIHGTLPPRDEELDEIIDPDFRALPNPTQIPVVLKERGDIVVSTKRVNLFSFSSVDPAVAKLVANSMVDTLDLVVSKVLNGGQHVSYGSGGLSAPTSTATVTADDTLSVRDLNRVAAKMRGRLAVPKVGILYEGRAHPDVTHDLRAESGAGAFEDIHKYTDGNVEAVLSQVLGVLGGIYWIETPRAFVAADGDDDTKVYRSIVAGDQALAEAVADEPHIITDGTIVDPMKRKNVVSWNGVLGHAIYREEALTRLESASSIAD